MAKEINYEKLEEEHFRLKNDLRTNPKNFIPKLRDSLNHFKDKIYLN